MKLSCIPPNLSWEKCGMVLSRNQGATGEHDEQYQMLKGT
jgi:hypothetical protein